MLILRDFLKYDEKKVLVGYGYKLPIIKIEDQTQEEEVFKERVEEHYNYTLEKERGNEVSVDLMVEFGLPSKTFMHGKCYTMPYLENMHEFAPKLDMHLMLCDSKPKNLDPLENWMHQDLSISQQIEILKGIIKELETKLMGDSNE